MKSATPIPQTPLRMSAPTINLGSQPAAICMPLSGNTTKSATAVGPRAPRSTARNHRADRALQQRQITAAQTPPQNANEITAGTPSGPAGWGCMGRAGAPDNQNSVSSLVKDRVDRKPAMKALA